MLRRTMMVRLIGTINAAAARPRGIRIVRAASGPYAAELKASRPNTGMPAAGPICSFTSSSDEAYDRIGDPGLISV